MRETATHTHKKSSIFIPFNIVHIFAQGMLSFTLVGGAGCGCKIIIYFMLSSSYALNKYNTVCWSARAFFVYMLTHLCAPHKVKQKKCRTFEHTAYAHLRRCKKGTEKLHRSRVQLEFVRVLILLSVLWSAPAHTYNIHGCATAAEVPSTPRLPPPTRRPRKRSRQR